MEHARLHGVHWAADDVGNLAAAQAVEVGEVHDGTVLRRQAVQRLGERFAQRPPSGLLSGAAGVESAFCPVGLFCLCSIGALRSSSSFPVEADRFKTGTSTRAPDRIKR